MEISNPIVDPSQLSRLCERIAQNNHVAVDTEFTRIKTYRPKLELVQLATEDVILCVDAVKCSDLAPLKDLFRNANLTFVFHAGEQDYEVLALNELTPKQAIDCQIAAQLSGYGKLSYKDLVHEIIGVELAKDMTRSDWNKRPFETEQIKYALDDVRYILPMWNKELLPRLRKHQRLDWCQQECNKALEYYANENKSEEIWKRFGAGKHLSPRDQQIARDLLVWRENRASHIDIPRQWVLADRKIVELIENKPTSLNDTVSRFGKRKKNIPVWLRQINSILQTDRPMAVKPIWKIHPKLTSQQKQLSNSIMTGFAEIAQNLNIPPELLCTRREANELARGLRSIRLFAGWRRQFSEKIVSELLENKYQTLKE